MFANFIYFIIVLLIYTTYQPAEETNFTPSETILLFLVLLLAFAGFARLQFRRLEKNLANESFARIDHKFTAALTRLSVMAIALFAVNIYGLNLSSFLSHVRFFALLPTVQALLFIGLFVGYLSIIWACAHALYQTLYQNHISRRSYIVSNIAISVPVLLPWLLLSGIADLINVMPFELPKRLLATTEGEILYFLIFLLAVAMTGPALIQKFWRCRPLEAGYDRQRIEKICTKAGMQYADILYWPIFGGSLITAGVMGLIKKFRYILVTSALLKFLEPEEIDSVIAHEIGHVKQKHLLFYLVFFVGYLLLSYATFDLIIFSIIYARPVYSFIDSSGSQQAAVTSAIFSLVIIVLFIVYFRYIFGFFMRNFERQADTYVYQLSDTARPLISTLEKIALTSGQPPDKPNWHHFSIQERIDYLKKCEADKSWIGRHNRKIWKSMAVYFMGILIMGGIGYKLNFGDSGRNLSKHFFEKILQRELAKSPDNPDLYSMLGDLYYSDKNYPDTIAAYENAIALAPENHQVLNNLAWLYATSEDEQYRNAARALALAKRAAEIKLAPHILDTLAESYYANGMVNEAISAALRSVELAKDNRPYYEEQLQKFENAAKRGQQ